MKTTLFVSHISVEAPVAAFLRKIIEDDFIRIVDLFASSDVTSIQGGEKWLDTIKGAIADSAAVLVLCSETSIHRPWVQFEIGAAWATGKRIIPICHSGMKLPDLPMPLSSLQGLELGTEAGLKKLYAAIAEVAGIPQAPAVKDSESRLQAIRELEKIYTPPPAEQFERYFNVLIPAPGRLEEPIIPDDAIIESDADSLRIFELAPGGAWKWRDIVEAARQTPDQRWLEQLQQCIALSSQNRVFRSVQAVYHSKSSGTFQPQLARREPLPNGGTMFHIHLVETVVARLFDVQGEFGLLATVLRLGLRFRYEVIVPYSKLLGGMPRNRTSADARDTITRLRGAVETIERDAFSRGAENIDTPSIIELFDDDANKQGIAEISERWEVARTQLFADEPFPTLDDLRKIMDEMRSINYKFMTLGTRRYYEMVCEQWKPKAPATPAPAPAVEQVAA